MFDFIHPMIVHFPIALVIVAFVAELFGVILRRDFFMKVALLLLIFGAIGIVAAYFSGTVAEEGINEVGAIGEAFEEHEDAGMAALWAVLVVTAIRSLMAYKRWMGGWRRWLAVFLLAMISLAVARTGYLGGELVFRHGGGVKVNSATQSLESGNAGTPETHDDDD